MQCVLTSCREFTATQGKTSTQHFHAITFSYENRMKIMRISCGKGIHVYHAKNINIFRVKIMRLSCYFRIY